MIAVSRYPRLRTQGMRSLHGHAQEAVLMVLLQLQILGQLQSREQRHILRTSQAHAVVLFHTLLQEGHMR